MKTEVVSVDVLSPEKSKDDIIRAAEIIKGGGLVVFPTETVYGLGGDGTNPDAARKIYAAKGRPGDNPLIIHIARPEDAEKYAETTEIYFKLAKRFMPGPLTVILKSKGSVPRETRGGLDTVAVRCPENKIARLLIEYSGVAIAAPSANLSGSPSPTTARHVIDDMMDRVDMIIDGGESEIGVESTVISIADGIITILRPGAVTEAMLSEIADKVVIDKAVTDLASVGAKPASPGMKYKHYAPSAEVILVEADSNDDFTHYVNSNAADGDGVFSSKAEMNNFNIHVLITGEIGSASELNHSLFSLLREADDLHLKRVYIRKPPAWGEHLALFNRLIRAAAGKIVKA